MLERLDRERELREARFKRLLENVTGRDGLAYQTAMSLREREAHEVARRTELHQEWDEKVFQPLSSQAYDHLNPRNRAIEQSITGEKSVSFSLPGERRKLVANVRHDPARKPVVETAREERFHQAALTVLQHSQSAP